MSDPTIIGTERRSVPHWRDGDVNLTVVIVMGEANDVAAYIGIGSPQWVAAHGNKLAIGEVPAYFPGFEQQLAAQGLTYRG